MTHRALAAFSVLFLAACRAPAAAPEPAPAPAPGAALPASALSGTVRALEVLAAVQPAGTLTQVRALEGDTLAGSDGPGEHVRVFLHLTVYAATVEAARAALEEIRSALTAEGRALERPALASAERVRRALAELDWDPDGREDLASYSDAVRVELRPGRAAPAPAAAEAAAPARPATAIETYVRALAAREHIGELELDFSAAPEPSGLRCRIAENGPQARHTRAEIGGFLAGLEGQSPVARLTQVRIERSQQEPDARALRGWTFAAELALLPSAGR